MKAHRLSIVFLLLCGIADVLCRTTSNGFGDVEMSLGISRVARGLPEPITRQVKEGNVIHDQPEIQKHILDKVTSWNKNARATIERNARIREYANELLAHDHIGPEYKEAFADFHIPQIGIQRSELKSIEQSITAADRSVADAVGDRVVEAGGDAVEQEFVQIGGNAIEGAVEEAGEALVAGAVEAAI